MYFLCHLVLFVSTLAKLLAGKTYSFDIFCVKGFPLQRPHWRVIYCNNVLYVFPAHPLSTFSLIFLTATYLSKAQYSLFVLKVPLNPTQLISLPWIAKCTGVVIILRWSLQHHRRTKGFTMEGFTEVNPGIVQKRAENGIPQWVQGQSHGRRSEAKCEISLQFLTFSCRKF